MPCSGVAVVVMRKGPILGLFSCEREQSRQQQGKAEFATYWEEQVGVGVLFCIYHA